MAEVHAKLKIMLAVGPVYGIRNLLTRFIREFRAFQESRGAEAEEITDGNVGGYEVVGYHLLLIGSWDLVIFKFEITPILETQFVGNGGSKGGIELGHSPCIFHEIIAKARGAQVVAGLRLNTCR